MKKIYSIALMAMMALCAMVVTSCGNDDDGNEPEKKEDTETTFSISVYLQAYNVDLDAELVSAVKEINKTVKNAVSNYSSVKYTEYDSSIKTGGVIGAITGSSTDFENVKKALENIDYTNLDNTLNGYSKTISITFCVFNTANSSEMYTSHKFTRSRDWDKFLFATWNYTAADGTAYALTINSKKVSDYEYEANLNVGGKDYPGVAFTNDIVAAFESTEMASEGVHLYEIGLTFAYGVEDSCTGKMYYKGDVIFSDVTFKK